MSYGACQARNGGLPYKKNGGRGGGCLSYLLVIKKAWFDTSECSPQKVHSGSFCSIKPKKVTASYCVVLEFVPLKPRP